MAAKGAVHGGKLEIPVDHMPEAEVIVRFTLGLLDRFDPTADIQLGIDGAHVNVGGRQVFPLRRFLSSLGWEPETPLQSFQGAYRHLYARPRLIVHSRSGAPDLLGRLRSGHQIIVEAKKGPLSASVSGVERTLLREALGQLLTRAEVHSNDLLVAAVPYSTRFCALANEWRKAPLVTRTALQIATVDRNNHVGGLRLPEQGTCTI